MLKELFQKCHRLYQGGSVTTARITAQVEFPIGMSYQNRDYARILGDIIKILFHPTRVMTSLVKSWRFLRRSKGGNSWPFTGL